MSITLSRARSRVSASPGLEMVSRAGLAARGFLNLVVAFLAARLAVGDADEKADPHGALQTVARQPFGRFLVLAAAAGFAGYAIWRFLQAAVDPDGKGDDAKGVLKRVGCAARGFLYVGFMLSALSLALGGRTAASADGSGSGSGNSQADLTARVLQWPFGRWIVVLAGAAVIGVGLYNGARALTRKFEKDLKQYEMTSRERCWTGRLAVVGLSARMVAYCLVGAFLVRAGVRADAAAKGVGLDAALHEVAGYSYGPPALAAVSLGLAAFGLYLLVQVRYRPVFDN